MQAVTEFPKANEIERAWYVLDATSMPLGRLSTKAAGFLIGKHKPIFAPHVDCGDFVIVVNAAKLVLTGNKVEQKIKFRHSGYPRGAKYVPYKRLLAEKPEEAVRLSVSGMLPKNTFRDLFLTRLKIYKGPEHPHAVQKPKAA